MKKIASLFTHTTLASAILLGSPTALSADIIKSYTSSIYELDDSDSHNKKIRLLYSVHNAWNQTHVPQPIKEVRLILSGGSGFDMTGVPKKSAVYESGTSADYLYSIPTAFQISVDYDGGAPVRHWSHAPSNNISTDSVSESSTFSLGITAGSSPTITGGVSWSNTVRYEQKEFDTIADYSHGSNKVTWDIINNTIQHATNPKNNLLYAWTSLSGCNIGNLIDYKDLPLVMRSNFKPEAAIVYRKESTVAGEKDTTNFGLGASWTKTNYYLSRDFCSFYSDFTWKPWHKDNSEITQANRVKTISWNDDLYR